MADPRPTAGQWRAIRELDRHLTVSAGAGAGKTWVLTERYTAMLAGRPMVLPPLAVAEAEATDPVLDPSRPQQIVAITFTKEAAGEMKARIRSRLTQWKQSAAEAEQRQIARLKEEVERASITTIHGFCSELLRQHPLEAGVVPQFRVLEESEASFLLDECLRELLDEGLAGREEALVRLVGEYGYEPLVAHVGRFYSSVLEHTEDFAGLAAQTVQQLDELAAGLAPAIDRLEALVAAVVALDYEQMDPSKASVQRALQLCQDWPQLSKLLTEWRADRFPYREEVVAAIAGLADGWGVLVAALKEAVNALKQQVPTVYPYLVPAEMKVLVQDVCLLLARLHHRYAGKKARAHALDFSDLQNRAVQVLQVPAVRAVVHAQLRFLMVDEFQDTNPLQKKLLDALAVGNEQLRLFVVGDAKQSIYRFRGADLEVFLETQAEVQVAGGEHVSLAHNFRTQQPIIDFINRLFHQLMPEQLEGPLYRTTYEPMEPTRPAAHAQPQVEVLHLTPQEDLVRTRLQEAEAVAARIAEMVGTEALVPGEDGLRPVQYRDVTILLAAMTNVHLYEHALQERGIPYYIVGSRQFFRRQEVIDLVLLLQVLVDPSDLIALVGVLRSPLVGVSDEALYWLGREELLAGEWEQSSNGTRLAADDREKLRRAKAQLARWRAQRTVQTAGDLLTEVLVETGYEQVLLLTFGGVQKVGNVRKLLDLAYDQPAERAGVLPFLRHVGALIDGDVKEADAQVESEQSDVVKIMTIHKSKGLEFPVVILPDLSRTFQLVDSGKFRYDPAYGLVLSFTEHADEWNELGYASLLAARNREKALEEERRKLYVAMTRARDYLLLVGSKAEPKSKKVATIHDSNWFDWLIATQVPDWPTVHWRRLGGEGEAPTPAPAVAQEGRSAHLHAIGQHMTALAQVAAGDEGSDHRSSATTTPLLGPVVPRAEERPGAVLSVSGLMTYLTCPRQYYYRYVWKLPELSVGELTAGAESGDGAEEWEPVAHEREAGEHSVSSALPALSAPSATERGTLVHRVFELLQDPRDLDALIDRALAEQGLFGPIAEQWRTELRRDAVAYVQSELFQTVQSATTQHSELLFRLTLGPHEITGIIDKVLRLPDGRAFVIDYKTNRLPLAALPQTVARYQPQLLLYALVTEQLLGWPVERAVLYFTSLDREAAISTSPADRLAFQQTVQTACDHIRLHDTREAYPVAADSTPCTTCRYRLLCAESPLT